MTEAEAILSEFGLRLTEAELRDVVSLAGDMASIILALRAHQRVMADPAAATPEQIAEARARTQRAIEAAKRLNLRFAQPGGHG